MVDPAKWTTIADIRKKVLRRWNSGDLLRDYAAGCEFSLIDMPLRGPGSADLAVHFDAARAWVRLVEEGGRGGATYDVEYGSIGGRTVGRTTVPKRVKISSWDQAWTLLGVKKQVSTYIDLLARTESWLANIAIHSPAISPLDWARANPLKALSLAVEWPRILAAWRWLDDNRNSAKYLRQVTAPGVDSKFVESHLGALSQMLGVPAGRLQFEKALGLASKPATVRLRFDGPTFGMPASITHAELRLDELEVFAPGVDRVLIVENEVTFLSMPIPEHGVVVWGKGYEVTVAGSLSWMRDANVVYWGDLDTHGFAILNALRFHVPTARSVLMDRETLLAHEERWGSEAQPTSAQLGCLTAEEAGLYSDLVSNRYGSAVRLEQERIDWAWVLHRVEMAWR
ncbi:MAG: DUF2220 family protein [Ancrocorticia sp.]